MNLEQKQAVQSLKTARGQIDGIIRMLEEGRYCIDISNQIVASQALLKKANLLVLKQHMCHCVTDAFEKGAGEEKVEEFIKVLGKIMEK